MKKDFEIKIEKKEKDKCEKCPFRIAFDAVVMEATEDARKAQEHYLGQIKKVNETLTKYNKKIEELDERDK
jgi:hypothetical protein